MNTLPRAERMHGRKAISYLFQNGQRFSVPPFRVVWCERADKTDPVPLRFGIAVSRNISKKAVERNRIKRLAREAYRTSKQDAFVFFARQEKCIDFFLVYTGTVNPRITEISHKIIIILKRLTENHAPTAGKADHRAD